MIDKFHLTTVVFLLIFLLSSCGFKPIYSKNTYQNNNDYIATLKSDNSLSIKEVFRDLFNNNSKEKNYKLEINITERSIPTVTGSDGTVTKYKIEIYAKFDLIEISNNKLIYTNYSRGFNDYLVVSSEYSTEQNKNVALSLATREALQILITKSQNHLAKISE